MPVAIRKPTTFVKTKKGRLINENFLNKKKKKLELKKVKDKNSTREVKEKLKQINRQQILDIIKTEKAKPIEKRQIKRSLLLNGIDARQFNAKGIPMSESIKIFGIADTIRGYGSETFIREHGGLKNTVKKYGVEKIIKSVDPHDIAHDLNAPEIIDTFGIERAAKIYNTKTVNQLIDSYTSVKTLVSSKEKYSKYYQQYIRQQIKTHGLDYVLKTDAVVPSSLLPSFRAREVGRSIGASTNEMNKLHARTKKQATDKKTIKKSAISKIFKKK